MTESRVFHSHPFGCKTIQVEKNNDKVAGENGKVGPEGEQQEAQRHSLGPSSLRVEKNGLEACSLEGK